jgi:hypothetical protein
MIIDCRESISLDLEPDNPGRWLNRETTILFCFSCWLMVASLNLNGAGEQSANHYEQGAARSTADSPSAQNSLTNRLADLLS